VPPRVMVPVTAESKRMVSSVPNVPLLLQPVAPTLPSLTLAIASRRVQPLPSSSADEVTVMVAACAAGPISTPAMARESRDGRARGHRSGPTGDAPALRARRKGVAVIGKTARPDRGRWVRLVSFMLHALRLLDNWREPQRFSWRSVPRSKPHYPDDTQAAVPHEYG